MILQNSVVKNRCGELYKVQLPRDNNAQLNLKSKSFWNEGSAQQFIHELTVPNDYWRDIIHEYGTTPCPSSLTIDEIEKHVSLLMTQGQLKFYPVDIPDISEQPPENRVIKGSDNTINRFMPISYLLLNKSDNVKYFNNSDEAKEYVSSLNPSDEKLTTIATELKITLPNTSSVNKGEKLDAIASALVTGKAIIIADKVSSPPPDESKVAKTKDTTGNRRADQVAPPVDEFKEITIDLMDDFDKNAPAFYELFDGLKYTLKTDQGEEHKGMIDKGMIKIPKAKMNSSFELEIKDMPAYFEV